MTSFEEFEEFYSERKDITPIYKVALDKRLPDVLNWNDVAELWASKLNRPKYRDDFLNIKNRRFEWILGAVRNEELQTHSIDSGTINQGINKYEFKAWLTQKELWPIDNCLLSLWWSDEELTQIHGVLPKQNRPQKREQAFTRWLRETWEKEGRPNGSAFFKTLKKYKNTAGSPIAEHFTLAGSGGKPGLTYSDGSNIKSMTKKTIENKVSKFKKTCQDT